MSRLLNRTFLTGIFVVVVAIAGTAWNDHRTAASGDPQPTPQVTVEPPVLSPRPTTSAVPGSPARTALMLLEVKGRAPKTGYSREHFGQSWRDLDRNGCDQRNDVLRRDLTDVELKPNTRGCLVLTGVLTSPYSGEVVQFIRGTETSRAVQIDHVVALSDAWQKGAQQWDALTRERFANDFRELIATDAHTNASKSDKDSASWLPPLKSSRCDYVAAQISVKATYGLWVTQAERDAMARVLNACPDQPLPQTGPIPLGEH